MNFKLGNVVNHKAGSRKMVIQKIVESDEKRYGFMWGKKKVVKRKEKDIEIQCTFPINPIKEYDVDGDWVWSYFSQRWFNPYELRKVNDESEISRTS